MAHRTAGGGGSGLTVAHKVADLEHRETTALLLVHELALFTYHFLLVTLAGKLSSFGSVQGRTETKKFL